jgi:hypothetical protein
MHIRDEFGVLVASFSFTPQCIPATLFAYNAARAVKRWPVILTGIIDNLHNAVSALYASPPAASPTNPGSPALREDAKILEGKALISQLSQLKYDMARDRVLPLIPDDGGIDVPGYNTALEELTKKSTGTWFTAPWLFAEYISSCCVMISINDYFQQMLPVGQRRPGPTLPKPSITKFINVLKLSSHSCLVRSHRRLGTV